MSDLTLIHNSTRELHTGVNKGKLKAEKLLTARSTLEISSSTPNKKESLHFCRWTPTHLYRDRHLSQRGLWLHFNSICFCHLSILTCLLCQSEMFFPLELCVCVVRIPGFLNSSGRLCWAWGSCSVFKANFFTILLVWILHHCHFCIWRWGTA